jgi:hypothetical protein
MADWPPEAIEDWKERASIVWEGASGSTEADWPAAKAYAEQLVRARWARPAAA